MSWWVICGSLSGISMEHHCELRLIEIWTYYQQMVVWISHRKTSYGCSSLSKCMNSFSWVQTSTGDNYIFHQNLSCIPSYLILTTHFFSFFSCSFLSPIHCDNCHDNCCELRYKSINNNQDIATSITYSCRRSIDHCKELQTIESICRHVSYPHKLLLLVKNKNKL